MHLVDIITLLILLSLGPGYPISGARISQCLNLFVCSLNLNNVNVMQYIKWMDGCNSLICIMCENCISEFA
jgi:hypothetical protein